MGVALVRELLVVRAYAVGDEWAVNRALGVMLVVGVAAVWRLVPMVGVVGAVGAWSLAEFAGLVVLAWGRRRAKASV